MVDGVGEGAGRSLLFFVGGVGVGGSEIDSQFAEMVWTVSTNLG
jgi:hypothetical protein